jgi:hypothetical protein
MSTIKGKWLLNHNLDLSTNFSYPANYSVISFPGGTDKLVTTFDCLASEENKLFYGTPALSEQIDLSQATTSDTLYGFAYVDGQLVP